MNGEQFVAGGKDERIQWLIARLALAARGWIIVDHWEADLCATGIASTNDPARLVYVSVFDKADGLFDYETEFAPRSESELYSPGDGGVDVSFDELLLVIERHLGAASAHEAADHRATRGPM